MEPILGVIGGLPAGTSAAFEAAYRWGWLVELLEDYGFAPHLVHPLRCKAIASARLKNDKVDAAILAQLLRADLLPEAWIAPPEVRQLRALLRHRVQLVRLRTLLRNRIHAVLADHGHDRPAGCWSGPGRGWLAALDLPAASREVVEDDLALIDALQVPIDRLDWEVHQRAKADPRVKVLTQLPGVGPFTALVILAEVGDVTRLGLVRELASRAGLTPHRARLGPHRLARPHLQTGLSVAAVGPVRDSGDRQAAPAAAGYQVIARRRGKKIATTTISRKLAARAWHLLTEAGHTSAPAPATTSSAPPSQTCRSRTRTCRPAGSRVWWKATCQARSRRHLAAASTRAAGTPPTSARPTSPR
ncbi:MAG TPA: IS110 family transposase [Streptosporangiaceae bacterium]|nr:IS110 family transposase [Streptosporangiaceae bacterium]